MVSNVYLDEQSVFVFDVKVESEIGLGGIVADLALELAGVLPLGEVAQVWVGVRLDPRCRMRERGAGRASLSHGLLFPDNLKPIKVLIEVE
jgi:hypothetical protein